MLRAADKIRRPIFQMEKENSNPNDEKLSALLRNARTSPALPPRFREGVWRRIEEGENRATARVSWLEAMVSWALRPKFALAAAVVLIATGSLVGAHQGNQAAHQDAQTRYIASVAPNSLR
jgi:hypothetical protein